MGGGAINLSNFLKRNRIRGEGFINCFRILKIVKLPEKAKI